MPYKSDAQRRFLHAKHPEIAAKWDAEIRSKKKGQIKKLAYEDVVKSDDPNFNHQLAKGVFDAIMKMDDETAEMFSYFMVNEVVEETIEKNLPMLQKRVNQIVEKRLNTVMRATARSVVKTKSGMPFATALAQISKVSPYDRGYRFKESDFSRDPTTGRFRTEVKTSQRKPIHDRTAASMGIPTKDEATQRASTSKLSPARVAAYQDQYRQLANFMNSVVASSDQPGDRDVIAHIRNRTGQTYTTTVSSTNPSSVNWDPAKEDLVGLDARPNALTAGGAYFGLSSALGRGGTDASVRRARGIDIVDTGFGDFANDWNRPGPGDEANDLSQTYRRLATGSQFVGGMAPPGSKLQMAARTAQFVGDHGPEAEKVIGPAARKTAYRYRGTSKNPDRDLLYNYDRAVRNAKYDSMPENIPTGQMAVRRRASDMRPATDEEINEGRKTIYEHLEGRLPKQDLYDLQLQSGNTPPSEGVLINSSGEIVDQAVGYGDDHYIPFNLKKLKDLRGGEYIRTRSVGGPTTEDIYVGLMSGAKQVTVVSRSGTFTVKFEPDFKGKRRYNDKARRMTGRYAQILDAVQSEKVDRATVPGYVRNQITTKVQQQFPGESRAVHRKVIEDRINEYKEDPDLTPEDDAFIARMVESRFSGETESRDAKAFRRQTTNDIMRRKGFRYKLDGAGYASALEALREQFPYYITVDHHIKDAEDVQSLERDKGYVEPGRNRPTAARANLFGTKVNPGANFISASHANYQGHRSAERGGTANGPAGVVPEGEKPAEAPKTPETATTKMENAVAQAVQRRQHADAAVSLHEALNREGAVTPGTRSNFPILNRDAADFASYVATPQGGKELEGLVEMMEANLGQVPAHARPALEAYRKSSGDAGFADYADALAFKWSKVPYKFPEAPYLPNAPMELRQQEVRNINSRTKSLAYGGNLSSLNEGQMKAEVEALSSAYNIIQDNPELQQQDEAGATARQILRTSLLGNYDQEGVGLLLSNPEMIKARLADVHRMRTLQALGGFSPEVRQQVTGRMPTIYTPEYKQEALSNRVEAIRAAQGSNIIRNEDAENATLALQDMMDRIDNGEAVSNVELDTAMAESEKFLPVATEVLQPHQRTLFEHSPHLFDLRVENGRRVPTLRKETR